ncbi:MAG TPA: hypothetical protein VJR92_04125 [Gemmatimonadaceae bacterium]|nr:hypothetical protein [Gemmatimonadaceae bacterium]
MRAVILVLLIAVLAGYLMYERKRNYPFDTITTPSGREFAAERLPDECVAVACEHRVAYFTSTSDSAAMLNEARELLPWLEKQLTNSPPRLAGVYAYEPGWMKLKAPKRVTGMAFAQLLPGTWTLIGRQDFTSEMRKMLEGR